MSSAGRRALSRHIFPLRIGADTEIATILAHRQSNRVFNVLEFGALANGLDASQNTNVSAINAAVIAANAAGGGVVRVPRGRSAYKVNARNGANVNLLSNVTLFIEPGAVIQAVANRLKTYEVIIALNASNVAVVGGGTIKGDYLLGHVDDGGEGGIGIKLRGVHDGLVEGLTITNCWGDGITVDFAGRNSRNVDIRQCDVHTNRRNNISIVGCVGGSITRCRITNAGGTSPHAGIDLEADTYGDVQEFIVRDNAISGNRGSGVQALLIERCQILGNQCHANGTRGIQLYRSKYCTIRENICRSNTGHGIYLTGDSTTHLTLYNSVLGNTCASNGGDGIRLDTASAPAQLGHTVVSGNICQGNTASGIAAQHTGHSQISGNEVAGNRGHGINVDGDSTIGVFVTANDVRSSTGIGIRLVDQVFAVTTDNTCLENGENGIGVANCSDSLVIGNTLVANGRSAGNTYDQILVAGNSDRNIVQSNIVRDPGSGKRPRYGIHISAATCEKNVVTNNQVEPGQTGSIQDSGTGTVKGR